MCGGGGGVEGGTVVLSLGSGDGNTLTRGENEVRR